MSKGKIDELFNLIQLIKYDKENINGYKKIEKYYEVMNSIIQCDNLVEFFNILRNIPVNEYIDIEVNQYTKNTLLDEEGILRSQWSNWFIDLGSKRDIDDRRFNEFREKCFELDKNEKGEGEDLYRITRLFIIDNPILNSVNDIIFKLKSNGIKKVRVRNIAKKYIEQCYTMISENEEYITCQTCNYPKYIKYKEASHNLCNAKYIKEELKKGQLIARIEIYHDIIKPGRFEKLCFEKLKKEGFEAYLFPEIERDGDILVIINERKYYLDMKAYNLAADLFEEVKDEKSEFDIKAKYKGRWIIVPDIFYKEQEDYLRGILNKHNSRIYDIDSLIKKLKDEEKRC